MANGNQSANSSGDRPYAPGGLRPGDKVLFVFSLFTILMTLTRQRAVEHAGLQVAALGLFLLFILVLGRFPFPSRSLPLRILRVWYPVAAIPLLFMAVGKVVSVHSARDGDALLRSWDLALFGAHPSVALQATHHPVLTEALQLVYSSFYFIPVTIGLALFLRGRTGDYDQFVFLVCYGFCLSYLGYFLLPAISPSFGLHGHYAFPLEGVWAYGGLSALQTRLESIHRDCFPSGHTMMTLVFLHFAWRKTRKLFYVLLPVGIALIFSTLYLRYHYAVDLVAGLAAYLFCAASAAPLYRLLSGDRPGPPGRNPCTLGGIA
ncbi:MAG: phosphatase PAP2 family protein [Acidobacteria bacterium]|nr:phosphatase PAP2 family protein [Acidobacteriota bacterium]